MLEIATYIKEVLCRHNTVVIPNLGAFEWHYKPAQLERLDEKLYAPVYYLAFNPEKHQDERQLLAHCIASKKGISLEAAKEQLIGYRLALEKQLLEQKEVLLSSLGSLKINTKGHPILETTENSDWAVTPGTGLPLLDAKPILRDKSYLNKEKQAVSHAKRKSPILLIGTIALVAVVAISSIWWIPAFFGKSKNDPTQISEISIMPIVTASQEHVLGLISAHESKPFTAPDVTIAAVDEVIEDNTTTEEKPEPVVTPPSEPIVEEKEVPKPTPAPITPPPTTETTIGANDYIVVIGVFGDAGNIERNERLLREKGYQTQVKQLYSGYTRVAAVVNCSSRQELNEKWAQIRSEFTPKAWVVRQ